VTVVVTTCEEGIRQITLSRPAKLNALTWEMVDQLHEALHQIARERDTRVVILTGEGRGFCSGLDIHGDDAVGTADEVVTVYDRQERVAGLALALRSLPQPVIAAIGGPAAGGGLALALASDVRICSPAASFIVSFVRLGLSGGDVGVSHLLPRVVGLGMASEMMLTGRKVAAEEALRIGLVNRMVEASELQPVRGADDQAGAASQLRRQLAGGRDRAGEPHAGPRDPDR
jgi:enoyl-CoA hydratase